MPLVHESKCGVCGAPRTTLDDRYVIVCAFCGALMDMNVGAWIHPSQVHLDAARNLVGDSKMAVRWRELAGVMYGVRNAKRPTYRADVDEYFYLYTYLFEDTLPARDLATVPARQAFAKRAAAQHLLREADPKVKPLYEQMLATSRALMDFGATPSQLLARTQAALDAATAFYAAMSARPEVAGEFPAPAKFYARMAVRATLTTIAPYIKAPGAVDRARRELLGDHPNAGRKCPHCGAPLEASPADAVRCDYCKTVIEQLGTSRAKAEPAAS